MYLLCTHKLSFTLSCYCRLSSSYLAMHPGCRSPASQLWPQLSMEIRSGSRTLEAPPGNLLCASWGHSRDDDDDTVVSASELFHWAAWLDLEIVFLLAGCYKNHWQNATEPVQSSKGKDWSICSFESTVIIVTDRFNVYSVNNTV